MRRCVIGTAGLVLLSTGCTAHHAAPPPPGPARADYRILLSTQPTAPRQLDPTAITACLTGKNGKPVSGAVVSALLAMPAMDMGRNEVVLHEAAASPGTYLGTGRFTMPGDWQVVVKAHKNGQQAQQSLTLKVQ